MHKYLLKLILQFQDRFQTLFHTRMHSSRMSTGRTLTVFRWRVPPPKLEQNLEPPQIRAISGAPPPP